MDRVLILHGWGGSDFPHWQSHLAAHIAQNYGTVSFPLLENCHFPSKNRWVRQVKDLLKRFQPTTVVCHSLANTVWFWLCEEQAIERVERLFLIAPPSLNTEEKSIKSFFPAPMPQQLYADEVFMIASDNDPWMSIDEAKKVAAYYHIALEVISDGGHLNSDSGYGKWESLEQRIVERR
jgi:predicted alpha/beta hydrolase family esterase